MPRKGRGFELAYADLFSLDKEKYTVESPGYIIDKITGEKREVDVIAKYKDEDGNERSIVVECRDRKAGEDIKSIEQLIQKKEDMEVDYYVVSTLYKFTKSAIKKARHYGVIIETAEMIKKDKIEEIGKEFFYDIFYIIPKLEKLNFLLDNKKVISFKNLYQDLNIIEKEELIKGLNLQLLSEIDFSKMIERAGIKIEDFFRLDQDFWCNFSNVGFLKDERFPIFKKLKIRGIDYTMKIKPYRLSLPINNSLSTFEVGEKKNKAFKVVFGNDDDNVTIGYLNDKEIISKAHLKPRKYHRTIGGTTHINTVFPKDAKVTYEIENIYDIAVNTFDYSDILN